MFGALDNSPVYDALVVTVSTGDDVFGTVTYRLSSNRVGKTIIAAR